MTGGCWTGDGGPAQADGRPKTEDREMRRMTGDQGPGDVDGGQGTEDRGCCTEDGG